MQRVLLAAALQQEPDLLILDEPASGVDFQGEHILCELLDTVRRQQGFTQLIVSHDLATVRLPIERMIDESVRALFADREQAVDGTILVAADIVWRGSLRHI